MPTPWPSWLIAARPDAPTEQLTVFLKTLTKYVGEFDSAEKRATDNVEFIKKTFGYPEADITEWLKTVSYPSDCLSISSEVISKTLR